jgi:dihydrofolate reductase
MRDLVVTENITLDGVIDTAGGWFSPSAQDAEVDQSDLQAALGEQQDAADALLVGRVTFEELRGYWPEQTDDTTGITDYLNSVSKYVVSTTLNDPEWNETIVLRAWKDDVATLKAGPGQDIVTTGSISLVHDLVAAGLVDEYRLFVYPVVLGKGRRLFDGGTAVPKLRLMQTRPFRNGVVLLRYRPA